MLGFSLGFWDYATFLALVVLVIHNVLFLGRFDFSYDANVYTPLSPWGVGVVLVPVAGALVISSDACP
jgi:CIC family chloride channel protein